MPKRIILLITLSLFSLFGLHFQAQAFKIEGVPFVKQKNLYCGPAALSSIMSFYGVEINQDTIAEKVFSEKLKGTLITDLENFAISNGFQAFSEQGNTLDLKNLIAHNRPVIVLIDKGFWRFSRKHFFVVFGFTEKGFIVHDGKKAGKLIQYKKFEKTWKKSGAIYLLIYQ